MFLALMPYKKFINHNTGMLERVGLNKRSSVPAYLRNIGAGKWSQPTLRSGESEINTQLRLVVNNWPVAKMCSKGFP